MSTVSMAWLRSWAPAIVGLALVQFALPKVLPLPGISARWLIFVPDGGGFARLAAIAGGVTILAFGLSLLPQQGWGPQRWGLLSAGVAVGTRLLAVGLALVLTAAAPTNYPWGAVLPVPVAFGLALLLVALCYGGGAAVAVALMRRSQR